MKISAWEAELSFPHVAFETPTRHYLENEPIALVALPAQGAEFRVDIVPGPKLAKLPSVIQDNRWVIPSGLVAGKYAVTARFRPRGRAWRRAWSRPSPGLAFEVHPAGTDITRLRRIDHHLESIIERGIDGVITLTDPASLPPEVSPRGQIKWFQTPSYEGATKLLNQEQDYYADPLTYFLSCIQELIERKVRFVTWDDMLDGKVPTKGTSVILQFDIDGGPLSMGRIYRALRERDVRGTVMTHRRGHYWYPYEIEDAGLAWLKEADAAGWCIGYHNNALSQVVGNMNVRSYDEQMLRQARSIFDADVAFLRAQVRLRTFTHHGGNVYNNRLSVAVKDLTGVDRALAAGLWRGIRSSFSDGGFLSRPSTLRQKICCLQEGTHFLRIHPFKYGNYEAPHDVLPRGMDVKALDRERAWLEQRFRVRSTVRTSYLRLDTPISQRFRPYREVEELIGGLRARRKASFLKLYPSAEHDPRVFWWRMLDSWAPRQGRILNVGALPSDQKDENRLLLGDDVEIEDMDIDPSRSPSHLVDVLDAPAAMSGQFDAVLLFGLPYFASPSAAVDACGRLLKPSGVALFGFVAETHPSRGGLWHRVGRPVWRKESEPLADIGLKGNLWSFDEAGVECLFADWSDVQKEFMGHYWFVACNARA